MLFEAAPLIAKPMFQQHVKCLVYELIPDLYKSILHVYLWTSVSLNCKAMDSTYKSFLQINAITQKCKMLRKIESVI